MLSRARFLESDSTTYHGLLGVSVTVIIWSRARE